MVRRTVLGSCFGVALVTGMAAHSAVAPAQAQELPVATVSAGSASVGDVGVALNGFFLEGERKLSQRLSIVGQVHRATATGDGYFSTIAWTDIFAGGGVRFTMRPRRVVQPHVHALFGLYQVSNDETITNPRRRPGPADNYTDNYAAFVFGAGLNIMPSPRVGIRLGADIQALPGVTPTVRALAGVVLPLGRRQPRRRGDFKST